MIFEKVTEFQLKISAVDQLQFMWMNCQCAADDDDDDDDDDKDEDDEEDASSLTIRTCSSWQFRCVSSGICISRWRVCDGYCHCSDCSDECGKCLSLIIVHCRSVFL